MTEIVYVVQNKHTKNFVSKKYRSAYTPNLEEALTFEFCADALECRGDMEVVKMAEATISMKLLTETVPR